MPRLTALFLVALAACGREAPVAPAPAPAPSAPAPSAPATPAPVPRDEPPGGDSILVGDPPTLVPGPLGRLPEEWTVQTTDLPSAREGVAMLREVRTGRHAGFDRVVFVLDGDALPGVHLEYVDRPARACGSGDPVRLEGEGWLAVRLQPAQAHTDAGAPTVTERRVAPRLSALREWAVTCDFEADVSVVLGLASPAGYRSAVLRDPLRLVVDVRHGT
ncbi:MAG TPA: hypothetical protein VF576_02430 [Rubricoccaceae bacterium]|jgi:hypothetical protein